MAMKMSKNRRVVEEICRRLGSSGAEKKLVAQNLPRVKLFKSDIYEKMISEKSIKEPVEYQKERKLAEDKMYGGTVL